MYEMYHDRRRGKDVDLDNVFLKLSRLAIAHGIGGAEVFRFRMLPGKTTSRECAEVFVLARSPDSFSAQGKGLGQETGFVVYHTRVSKPEGSDG